MNRIPARLLDLAILDGRAQLRYLSERDRWWVKALCDAVVASVGLERAGVVERLAATRPDGAPRRAWEALSMTLLRHCEFETAAGVVPRRVREMLFAAAARAGPGVPRGEVVAGVAARLGTSADEVERSLYADLPGVRRLVDPGLAAGPPQAVAKAHNLALAQSLLCHAERVRVRVDHGCKAVLRFARLMRLLCVIETGTNPQADSGVIRVEGPLSLFRVTTMYGERLAAWLPALVLAPAWRLVADVVVRKVRATFAASHHDPIGSTHAPPRRFDSAVEECLFRGLSAVRPRWHIVREADPAQVGGRLLCPDFTIEDPDRGQRVPVEVVGYWTPEYLADKLAVIRALPPASRWVVCIDECLCGRAGPLPEGPVFTYRRKVDARAFAVFLEGVMDERARGVTSFDPSPPLAYHLAVRGEPAGEAGQR